MVHVQVREGQKGHSGIVTLYINLVIDEKLWCHCYETKSEKEAISRLKTEGIPPFVFIVDN